MVNVAICVGLNYARDSQTIVARLFLAQIASSNQHEPRRLLDAACHMPHVTCRSLAKNTKKKNKKLFKNRRFKNSLTTYVAASLSEMTWTFLLFVVLIDEVKFMELTLMIYVYKGLCMCTLVVNSRVKHASKASSLRGLTFLEF